MDTVAAFQWTFKLRKLKFRIENTPNGETSISQKLIYRKKKSFCSHKVFFSFSIRKVIFYRTAIESFFFILFCVFLHLQVTYVKVTLSFFK